MAATTEAPAVTAATGTAGAAEAPERRVGAAFVGKTTVHGSNGPAKQAERAERAERPKPPEHSPGEQLAEAMQATGALGASVPPPMGFDAKHAGHLQIDHAYQRAVSRTWVQTLVNKFDWAKFGSLYVNERANGQWVVVSGQHRLLAVVEKWGGQQLVPCLMYYGLSRQQEARLYLSLDADRRAQMPHDLFKAKVSSGDPAAREVARIAREFGLEVATTWTQFGEEGALRCVSTVQRLHAQSGAERLRLILGTLTGAFEKERDAFQQHILTGLNLFFNRYTGQSGEVFGQADPARVIAVLKKAGMDELQRQAKGVAMMSGAGGGSSASRGVAIALQLLYNDGLKGGPGGRGKLMSWLAAAPRGARATASAALRGGRGVGKTVKEPRTKQASGRAGWRGA